MAISANDFWQQLTRIGLVDTATCRAWIDRFQGIVAKRAAASPDAAIKPLAADAITVAQFLIANRVLTKFQSQRLLAGRGSELRLGEYLVVDRCDQPPLSRWYRGRHLGTGTECFLYPCTDALTSPRWVDPAWLAAHAAVRADGLQPIYLITFAAADPWRGAVVSELPAGRSLDQWAADQGPLDHATVASIGMLLSNSLAEMHAAGLVHGELRPSRIWCGEDRSLWMLRDAGRPPVHPADPPQEHRWFDDDSLTDLYAAPEFANLSIGCSPATDLFSLGAVLYELATGRKLVQRGRAFDFPADITIARDAGAAGDPLMRSLAFANDPNPEARFPDVASFSRALGAVVDAYQTLRTGPTTKDTAVETAAFENGANASANLSTAAPPPRPTVPVETAPPASKPAAAQAIDEAGAPGPRRAAAAPLAPSVAASVATPLIAPQESAAVAAPSRVIRRRTRRTRRGPIIVGSVAAAVLLGMVAWVLRSAEKEISPRPRPSLPLPSSVAATGTPTARPPTSTVDPASAASAAKVQGGFELVQDERLLWASPWSPESAPPPLEMIPPGSQLIVTLRLSRLLSESAETRWLDWLGLELRPALVEFEKRAGVSYPEVERLTIAFSAGSGGNPKAAYTVTLGKALDVDALAKAWKVSPTRTPQGKTIYSSGQPMGDAFYISENSERNRTFVFGPLDLVSLIAENDGDAIPLPRSLQQLWETASVDAELVALTVPNFLFADGRELLSRYAPRATEALRAVLMPDVAGAIVSMSFVDAWYVETRLTPSGTVSAPAILQSLRPRIEALPVWAEAFAIDAKVDTSWRAMAIRMPQFMRAIADQTRYGVSKTLPTINLYLPSEAAPQVVLGTVLALSSTPSDPLVETIQPPPMAPLSIEEMLDSPLSVSFDQESLQFAVEMIRDEFVRTLRPGSAAPEFNIIGGDLEKMGITQNQQIRNFQMRDRPLRDALTELVRQANPDKSITTLTDPKQSLVWVIDPAKSATPTILITTRAAAAANNLDLPKEFVATE